MVFEKIDKNIFRIDCKTLHEYPQLLQRILNLGQLNTFIISNYIMRGLCNHSELLLYCNFEDETVNDLIQFPELIDTFVLFVKGVILYIPVCIYPELNIDAFKELIIAGEDIFQDISWIVNIPIADNTYQIAAALAEIEFMNPILLKHDPLFNPLPYTVLTMEYNKYIRNDKLTFTINRIQRLLLLYNEKISQCEIKIHFDKNLADSIKTYLQAPVEYAGVLEINNGKYHLNQQPTPGENIILPNGTVDYNVDIGTTHPITFHIHPSICYKTLKCYVGWPSAQDIARLIYVFPHELKHYVITLEGIYALELSFEFQKYLLTFDKPKRDYFFNIIYKHFSDIHSLRSETINKDDIRHFIFYDFFRNINSFTINKLLTIIPESSDIMLTDDDFCLFTVYFYNWEFIDNNDGFIDTATPYNCQLN